MDRREAIILLSRRFREVDRLIVALAPAAGRLEVLARGTRKIESKLSSGLMPFARVALETVRGRQYIVLTGVEGLEFFPRLRTRLTGLAQAGFVAEVAGALSAADQPEPRLYQLVLRELRRIERGRVDRLVRADVLALSLFALRALAVTGWKPRFGRCSICQRPLNAAASVFIAHPYGFAHAACAGSAGAVSLHRSTRKFLFDRLSRITQSTVVPRGVASEVNRVALMALEAVLDRELKSRRFLRTFIGKKRGSSAVA